eukprot:gene5793-11083_t
MHIKTPFLPDADSDEEEIDNGGKEFETDSSWEESESETDEESAGDKTEDDKEEPSTHGNRPPYLQQEKEFWAKMNSAPLQTEEIILNVVPLEKAAKSKRYCHL